MENVGFMFDRMSFSHKDEKNKTLLPATAQMNQEDTGSEITESRKTTAVHRFI